MSPTPLVLAKAPVPGRAKTRLAADVGDLVAADLAAAALLDTLDVTAEALGHGVVALAGDLDSACRAEEIADHLAGWRVVAQEGNSFADRIVHAHAQVSGPVLQIGMDTPHLSTATLREAAEGLTGADAVLGLAEDGGWWVLGLCDPGRAVALVDVPTSRPDTGQLTLAALGREMVVATTTTTYDVDTVVEAERSAADAPHTRFAITWASLERTPEVTRR